MLGGAPLRCAGGADTGDNCLSDAQITAVKALNAGVDLILLCAADQNFDVLMSALIEADQKGEISLARENETRERLKRYVFVDERELPPSAPVQARQ